MRWSLKNQPKSLPTILLCVFVAVVMYGCYAIYDIAMISDVDDSFKRDPLTSETRKSWASLALVKGILFFTFASQLPWYLLLTLVVMLVLYFMSIRAVKTPDSSQAQWHWRCLNVSFCTALYSCFFIVPLRVCSPAIFEVKSKKMRRSNAGKDL